MAMKKFCGGRADGGESEGRFGGQLDVSHITPEMKILRESSIVKMFLLLL
jgi:hypothetical protein